MFGFLRGPAAGKYLFFTLNPAVSDLWRINERGGRKTQTHLLELPAGRFVIPECALTASFSTRLDIVEKLSNRFKHGMLLRRACAMWDADARRTARYIDLSMISCVYEHLRLESCVSVVAPYCTLRERHSGYIN